INPVASPIEIEKLYSWEEDIDSKLINKAIEIAVNNNARKYSYINAILNNWLKDNIKTLEQYEALEQIKQKEGKNGVKKTNGGNTTNNKPTAEDFRKIIGGRTKIL
ncbi:MAG: DnaD domain protein, partial [Eubacteriales bacterium]|nr:DnaD domain protein [Eubacteriales bacterium]